MTPPRRPRLRRIALVVGLGSILATGATRATLAGDEPRSPAVGEPPGSQPYELSAIEGDPAGAATKLDRDAQARLVGSDRAAADPEGAARVWMQLVEDDVASLLPAPRNPWDFQPTGREEGLLWPAREVALTRLAVLEPRARALVEARWGPAATRALADAGVSSDEIDAIAARYPVTDAGSSALLLAADRRLETGLDAEAVPLLWRWLRLRMVPVERRERVASVLARLFDALVRLDDARGIAAAARVCVLLPGATVTVGGARRDVADLPARAMTAVRERLAARPAAPPADPPPAAPTLAWSLDVDDRRLAGGHGVSTGVPSARVAVEGDAVYVCDARRVRRVDRATGLVRWTYPSADPLPRDFDPDERSRSFETPARDVVVAGDLVLVVLGSPPVSTMATFLHDGEVVHGSHLARETRTRIVALDATDGHAVWWSGRVDETDPVVGAADVGVTSPLMVDGDSVSAVVAARRGAVECWLATFDLATGRVRRTTHLARAESGRVISAGLGAERTLEEVRIRGLPRAQRPVRSADEIVVVSGAGFAAGVASATGRLRWVGALPRYVLSRWPEWRRDDALAGHGAAGFSPHNEPVAGFGSWFVAAEDASRSVALEAGSGRLRWVGSTDRPGRLRDSRDGFPEAPHLFGAVADERGRAAVVFAGGAWPLEVRDATSGALLGKAGLGVWTQFDAVDPGDDAGRPTRAGASLRCVRGGRLRTLDAVSEPTGPWRERDARPAVPPNAGTVEGDLVVAGDLWLVVGPERVVALADTSAVLAASRAPGRDGADRAARSCSLARRAPSRGALAAAVAASAREPEVRAQLLPGAVDALLASGEGIASVGDAASLSSLRALVDALDPPARARAYLTIFRGLELAKRDERIVELLDAWLEFGDRALLDYYEPSDRMGVRSDLYASEALPAVAARSAPGRAALERREPAAEAAIVVAKALGESALVEAIRRAGGTRAAWLGRFDLLALRIDAGRFADAASTAADIRTTAPDLRPSRLAVDLGSAAAHALRGLEADLLARVGEHAAAREALFDADRDGPALARTLDGGPSALLRRALERWSGGPGPEADAEGRLELFAGERTPSEQARRDALVLEPVGPGASEEVDRVLVAKGLDLEVRSLATGAVWPMTSIDAAFLGAVLQDRETAMPGPGVRIASVVAGGGADRAGLRAGDWILRWAGRDATDRPALLREIARTPVGQAVAVEAVRRGARLEFRVTPARRSPDDRSPAPPSRAVYPGDGTALVPSRFGLTRVRLDTGVATSIWASRHRGEVVEAVGFAGTHFVLVATSPLGDTTVAALDAATGAERWVTTLEGSTSTPPRVVGSALVVDTDEPWRTWLLDRETGSVRARYARSVAAEVRPRGSAHPSEPRTSVDAGGVVWLWREGPARSWLSAVDPASGMMRFQYLPTAAGSLLPRPLAGGGLVATAMVSDTLLVFLPDLRGGVEPFGSLRVDGTRFGTQTSGVLDFLSRLAVGGDCVYVARITTDKRAALGAVEIDRRAARGLASGDPVNWHPGEYSLLKAQTSATQASRSDAFPVFASLRASLDGAWACATYWDSGLEGAAGRSVWFEPLNHDATASVRTEDSLLYVRGPVPVGSRVLVPTDGGYVVVPRRPHDPR